MMLCLIVSCSSDNGDDDTYTYTGSRFNADAGELSTADLYFDENYENYIRDFGAVFSLGNDTTLCLGVSSKTTTDNIELSIEGKTGNLRIIRKEEIAATYRNAATYILQFSNGEYDMENGKVVVCKDSAYLVGNGRQWRLLLDNFKLVMHKWKGDNFDKSETRTGSFVATGSINGDVLSLNRNDTTYRVQGVGADEVMLKMLTPIQDEISLKRKK